MNQHELMRRIAEMLARIEALEAKVAALEAKRGPGRPPKDA
jgi:BMFP domain-containing protein YqiC